MISQHFIYFLFNLERCCDYAAHLSPHFGGCVWYLSCHLSYNSRRCSDNNGCTSIVGYCKGLDGQRVLMSRKSACGIDLENGCEVT